MLEFELKRVRPAAVKLTDPDSPGQLRVAVLGSGVLFDQRGDLYDEYVALWRAAASPSIELTLVGTYGGPRPDDSSYPNASPLPFGQEMLQSRSLFAKRDDRLWRIYLGLSRCLKALQPDVIHVNSEPWGMLVAQTLFAAKAARLKSAIVAHGCCNIFHHGPVPERLARQSLLRCFLPQLDGYASWNQEGIRLAFASGLPASSPTIVLPAIVPDPTYFVDCTQGERAALREAFGLPQDRPVVAFIGRLVPEKGISDLVAAIRCMNGTKPVLAFWGSGPLESQIQHWLDDTGVDCLIGGPLHPHSVRDALRASDIVAVPSKTTPSWVEQFGRIALEAMLVSRPVVAYRSGALPAVLGEAGLLVREGDIASLARAIEMLAANEDRRRAAGAAGRRRALRELHPAVLAGELKPFWQRAAASHRHRCAPNP